SPVRARGYGPWPGVPGRRGSMPAAALSSLAHDEPLEVMVAVGVGPAGRAGTRRGARHLADEGALALVQSPQAGRLDRLAPAAVPFDSHEPLCPATRIIGVVPDGRAVARRCA